MIGQATNAPGISTVSILREANARGIAIKPLSLENKDEIKDLKIDEKAKKEIANAVEHGKMVIVPEKSMYFYDWYGTGSYGNGGTGYGA